MLKKVKKWEKGLHSKKGQVMGYLKDGNKSWLEWVEFFDQLWKYQLLKNDVVEWSQ